MPATRTDYGVSSFDNGLNFYKACLKFHTSTDISPEEIRDIGIEEVTRIKALMEKVKVTLGSTTEIVINVYFRNHVYIGYCYKHNSYSYMFIADNQG